MFARRHLERSALQIAPLCLLLAGCGGYADFTLPPLPPAQPVWLRFFANAEPVLTRGAAADALNPSVVLSHNRYVNFYSEYDGRAWHTALAESTDGQSWQRQGRILSPDPATWEGTYIAANGALFEAPNSNWLYWYQSGPRDRPSIGLAAGPNPRALHKQLKPVLTPGPRGAFDEFAVADPYVIRVGDWFYMYYLGMNRARQQQIGLARSQNGFVWSKLRTSPVLAIGPPGGMDENGLGEPAVWQSHGWYWMLFTGRDAHENRALGLARSADGVVWVRSADIFHGAQLWNQKVLCDPTVSVQGGQIHVWFGGGDVASPDENLHGQIGYGQMRPAP